VRHSRYIEISSPSRVVSVNFSYWFLRVNRKHVTTGKIVCEFGSQKTVYNLTCEIVFVQFSQMIRSIDWTQEVHRRRIRVWHAAKIKH
jgi:hypothetical protein